MIQLRLDKAGTEALQILCLGCHSDDIEIGCGGTILRLAEEYPDCVFHWVVFSAIGVRGAEAQHAASSVCSVRQAQRAAAEDFPGRLHAVCGRRNQDALRRT